MPQPGEQHSLEQIAGPAGKLISDMAQHLLDFCVPKLGQGQIGGMALRSGLPAARARYLMGLGAHQAPK